MKWRKYTIHTTTEAEDLVSLMLNELGVEGVQIENNVPLTEADTKGMFIDILPELPEDDGSSRLSFFLREEEPGAPAQASVEGRQSMLQTGPDKDASVDASYSIQDRVWSREEIKQLLRDIREGLRDMSAYTDVGSAEIEEGESQDTDWRDKWKEFFRPIRIGGFLILPGWCEPGEEDRKALEDGSLCCLKIDPGTAFGTGSHETTQLCLSMLEKYLKEGDAVLDVGTGSGILGIAALKKGASGVFATELDEACVPSIQENLERNGIKEKDFALVIGNLLQDDALRQQAGFRCYDIVMANILAPVIAILAQPGQADCFVKDGGIFISSGIIDTKEEELCRIFRENPSWEVLELRHSGEWVGIAARKNKTQQGGCNEQSV